MSAQHSGRHPYDPLTAAEITAAVAVVRKQRPELLDPRFPLVRTDLPAKEVVRGWDPSAEPPVCP